MHRLLRGLHPRIRRTAPCLLAVSCLLALAGCGGGSSEAQRLTCPRPAIIARLASVERYRDGTTKGPTDDLAWRAALENVRQRCMPQGDDLVVAVLVDTVVEPGPAYRGGPIELPYFVAVVTPDGEVLDRKDFVATVPFAAGQRRSGTTEQVSERFIGRAESGAQGYQILFGLPAPKP